MCEAIAGMAFGDEGKGAFVDFLASRYPSPLLIKYCGGAQASHSVLLPDGSLFRFSQLSAGMTAPGAVTCLSDNFVVNPFSLAEECRAFSAHTGIGCRELAGRVLLDTEALTVTRFHRALNRLEMEQSRDPRGSVGTGVSTAAMLARQGGPSMRVKELFSEKRRELLSALQDCLAGEYGSGAALRPETRGEIERLLRPEAVRELDNEYGELFDDFRFGLCRGVPCDGREIVCEGSQGFLLDWRCGTLPNVTGTDTSAAWVREHFPDAKVYGAVRSFWSRHGPGAFPSGDETLRPLFSADEQELGRYNGRIRYGYFDLVLFRYSIRHNTPDALALSFTELLERFDRIPVCRAYLCDAEPDGELGEYFDTTVENGQRVIRSVRSLCAEACAVLKRCRPVLSYLRTPTEFIRTIEEESRVPVELVSRGPGRADKRWYQS